MPTLGGVNNDGSEKYGTTFFSGKIDVQNAAQGPTDLYVTPIVPDRALFPDQDSAGADGPDSPSLRDFTEGQDWLLKRIVGKLYVSVDQKEEVVSASPAVIIIGAGFFVGRADDTSPTVPDTNNAEIDPLGSENVRQPWIWRRTWLMRNGVAIQNGADEENWLITNQDGAGLLDGPHIDSKVARRIRREERLWFCLNAYGGKDVNSMHNVGPWDVPGTVTFLLDYRVLGAMRRSTNRSTF